MDTQNMILTIHRRDAAGIPRPIISIIDPSSVEACLNAISRSCGMDCRAGRRARRQRREDAGGGK